MLLTQIPMQDAPCGGTVSSGCGRWRGERQGRSGNQWTARATSWHSACSVPILGGALGRPRGSPGQVSQEPHNSTAFSIFNSVAMTLGIPDAHQYDGITVECEGIERPLGHHRIHIRLGISHFYFTNSTSALSPLALSTQDQANAADSQENPKAKDL